MISAGSPIRWTFSSAAVSALVMGVQLAVLSRFLSASQLGLAALALMILGVAALISDFGIGRILSRSKEIWAQLRTSLYSLELVLGVACLDHRLDKFACVYPITTPRLNLHLFSGRGPFVY